MSAEDKEMHRARGCVCTGCSDFCRDYLAEHERAECGGTLASRIWEHEFGGRLRPMCHDCYGAVRRLNRESVARVAEETVRAGAQQTAGLASSSNAHSGAGGEVPVAPNVKPPPPRPSHEMMAMLVGFEQMGSRVDGLERRLESLNTNINTMSTALGRLRDTVVANEAQARMAEEWLSEEMAGVVMALEEVRSAQVDPADEGVVAEGSQTEVGETEAVTEGDMDVAEAENVTAVDVEEVVLDELPEEVEESSVEEGATGGFTVVESSATSTSE